MTVIIDRDAEAMSMLRQSLGADLPGLPSLDALREHLKDNPGETTVVIGPTVDQRSAFAAAERLRLSHPSLGVVLVRRRIDTSLLAEALRAGVREVVEERDLAGINAAAKRVAELATALRGEGSFDVVDEEAAGRVVTVFSAKGGAGKTTVATNLAAALADKGTRSVCLVDLDLQFGDVAIVLQLFPENTIADAVPLGEELDPAALQTLLTQHSPGLAAVIAPTDPSQAAEVTAPLVARLLELLRRQYDFVIVDTPPAFDDQVLAALDASDLVALVATLDIPALKNLKLTLETLDLLNYPKDRIRVLLNRSDSKVGLSLAEVEKTLRSPISSQIPSSRDVPASINRGTPLMLDDPKHPVSMAIRNFATEHVLPLAGAARTIPEELRRDRRGLLRRRSKT
jgi:pilus assembly protein CpaE